MAKYGLKEPLRLLVLFVQSKVAITLSWSDALHGVTVQNKAKFINSPVILHYVCNKYSCLLSYWKNKSQKLLSCFVVNHKSEQKPIDRIVRLKHLQESHAVKHL